MLKKRVIPIVLLDGFSVLKTINFDMRRNLGSPVTVMRTYNTRNVDEMIILDIDASKANRSVDKFTIQELSADCFMPLTIGGGIRSCDDIESLLKAGADKISINTYAYENPLFIKEAAGMFGSQCIVASVDCVKVSGEYKPFCNGQIRYNIKLVELLKQLEELGVGEILVNDVSRDGTMSGYDSDLARLVTENIMVPIIFSGGISSPENAADLVEFFNVDAVGISSLFQFSESTPEDCRSAFKCRDIPAR